MVDSSSSAVRREKNRYDVPQKRYGAPAGLVRVPEARQSAANDSHYAQSVPQKTSTNATDPDAFMSPKWADVDKRLNRPPTSDGNTNQAPRTFGAPDMKGKVAMQRGVTPQEGQNRLSSAAYGAGYALGNKIANTRDAIVSAPQNARDAVARKQAQMKQGVTNAKNLVMNAPANIKNTALNKQKLAQDAVGVRSGNRRESANRFRPGNARLRLSRPSSFKEEAKNLRENAKKMAVKGGPVLFWLVAGIAVIKDLIDVFSLLIHMFGFALEATVIGAPLGLGLQVLSEIIDKLAGLFIDVTLLAYFGYIGGGFALRLVIMSVGAIIDALPLVDILPLTTISFFAAYLLGRAAKKVVQVAESSLGRAIGKTGAALGGAARMGGRFVRAISR